MYHTSRHLYSFTIESLTSSKSFDKFILSKAGLIVNKRAIKLFNKFNISVNSMTIKIDNIFNKLFPHKAAYILVLLKKN